MGTLLAELNTRVLLAFADMPQEYLLLHEVHDAVVQKHSIRLNLARISDINVLLSVSPEFMPNDEPYDITALISNGTPSFVEMNSADGWQRVNVVNVADIADAKNSGITACAFYGDESNGFRQYVQFAFNPSANCRIKFDKSDSPGSIYNTSSLPAHVVDLIVLEAVNQLIPKIKMRVINNMNRKQQTTKDVQLYFNALDSLVRQNMADIENLEKLWAVWAFRDRGAQNNVQTRRRIITGRDLYGG